MFSTIYKFRVGGVETFFVLSSFFLVNKYWGTDNLNVSSQFKHRIIRLYPPYVAVVVMAAIYALLRKKIPFDLVPHLLSAQNFYWMITGYQSAMQPMTAHTWTLSIEVFAGLVWLLIIKQLSKKEFKNAMYWMIILAILYRSITIILGCNSWIVSLCPIAHFDAFACGSLLAIKTKYRNPNTKTGIGLVIVGILGILSCIIHLSNVNESSLLESYILLKQSDNFLNNVFTGNLYLFISLISTGFISLLVQHNIDQSLHDMSWFGRMLQSLGDDSYNLYLFHWPILILLLRYVNTWKLTVPLTLIISLIANMIFKYIVKRIHIFKT